MAKKKKEKTSPDRDKGSYRHMLDLVSSPKFESILNDLLESTGARLAESDCRHPIGRSKKKDWTEAEVEDYLKTHPIDRLPRGMDRKWWIPFKGKRPTWDLLCHIEVANKPGLLLVEAKAHVGEIGEKNRKTPPEKGNPRSLANDYSIRLRLAEASLSLAQLNIGNFHLSSDHHYQFSNRITYLHKLAREGVPTVLMYLGWLNSSDWTDDPLKSHDHWEKIMRDHMEPIAPRQFAGGQSQLDDSATMQMIVRSVEASMLDGK